MNYTTNFNLNKPEGTDLYNHLTVDNPNMDTIDAAMQANKLASVGNATELVSGTVHAITRSDNNQNIFRFKATGDFKAGDTITVDGVSVNAYTTAGQQLANDAYVLSAQVLCILDATSLWVFVNKDQDAEDVNYDNTTSSLTATDVQNAIDEVVVNLRNSIVYNDVTVTTGTTLHSQMYFGDTHLAYPLENLMSATPFTGNPQNLACIPVVMSNGDLRVFSPIPSATFTIRVVYKVK